MFCHDSGHGMIRMGDTDDEDDGTLVDVVVVADSVVEYGGGGGVDVVACNILDQMVSNMAFGR